jgi:hypothetical protein
MPLHASVAPEAIKAAGAWPSSNLILHCAHVQVCEIKRFVLMILLPPFAPQAQLANLQRQKVFSPLQQHVSVASCKFSSMREN